MIKCLECNVEWFKDQLALLKHMKREHDIEPESGIRRFHSIGIMSDAEVEEARYLLGLEEKKHK